MIYIIIKTKQYKEIRYNKEIRYTSGNLLSYYHEKRATVRM